MFVNAGCLTCHCWPCRCHHHFAPAIWCSVCSSYTFSPHYHYSPPILWNAPPCSARDEALREEGRREERARKRRHRPYVDITPALPHYRR